MRAAIYLRVSTAEQTPDNQERELRAAAERMGHEVVEICRDHAVRAARARAPGLRGPAIRTLPAARSTWSWRGRSIGSGAATCSPSSSTCARPWFFLHQPGLDTTTSSRRAMFGMLSVFAAFERKSASAFLGGGTGEGGGFNACRRRSDSTDSASIIRSAFDFQHLCAGGDRGAVTCGSEIDCPVVPGYASSLIQQLPGNPLWVGRNRLASVSP
jgi:hypothetical protein